MDGSVHVEFSGIDPKEDIVVEMSYQQRHDLFLLIDPDIED